VKKLVNSPGGRGGGGDEKEKEIRCERKKVLGEKNKPQGTVKRKKGVVWKKKNEYKGGGRVETKERTEGTFKNTIPERCLTTKNKKTLN